MKILWVDDHEILCVALSEYVQTHASELGATPIEVTPVFTLASALEEVAKAPPPDLVFLDLNLDGDNRGATTLERFQAGNSSNVPVVICTGLLLETIRTLKFCECACATTPLEESF